jgi:hypothetical protein
MDDVGGAEPHVDGDVPVISMSRLVITKLGCTKVGAVVGTFCPFSLFPTHSRTMELILYHVQNRPPIQNGQRAWDRMHFWC